MHTRRLFLFRGMAGAAAITCATRSSAALADASVASCSLTAEQEVGPYYLDLERMRQDVTEGRPGLPLKLRLTVVDATRCVPLESAALDIWHCDAMGVYSGFTANSRRWAAWSATARLWRSAARTSTGHP